MQNDKKRKLYLGVISILTAIILSFLSSEYYFYDLRLLNSDELHIIKFLPGDDVDLYSGFEEVSITFDQDITEELGTASPEQIRAVHFVPQVDGEWRWTTPRQLSFRPKVPFESNKTYSLKVAGIISLSGCMLNNLYEFKIVVPSVKITEIFVENPNGSFDRVPPIDEVTSGRFNASSLTPRIIVLLDSPIPDLGDSDDADSFERNFKELFYEFEMHVLTSDNFNHDLYADDVKKEKIPLRYCRPSSRNDVIMLNKRPEFAEVIPELSRILILYPNKELQKATIYKLDAITANSGSCNSFKFQTNDDFRALVLGEKKCPDLPVTILFSNAVNQDDVIQACKISPPVNGTDKLGIDNIVSNDASFDVAGNSNRFSFILPFTPGEKYKLTLDPALQDAFGNTLTGNNNFEFIADDYQPMVKCHGDNNIIMPSYANRKITLDVLNARRSNVSISRIRDIKYNFNIVHLVKGVHTDKLNVNFQNIEKNKVTQYDLDLLPFIGNDKYAWLYIQFDYDHGVFVQFTDLKIEDLDKRDKFQVIMASGRCGALLNAELRGNYGEVLWKGRADADGIITIPGIDNVLKQEPDDSLIHLVVYNNKDKVVKFFKLFLKDSNKDALPK